MTPRRPCVHVWLDGQRDNVGDSALRRGYADALRRLGSLNVWTGSNASSYRSGLRLAPEDHVPQSYLRWLALTYRGALRGETIALNAGEFTLSKVYALYSALLLPAIALTRLRRGQVLWLGAGVPKQGHLGKILFIPLARCATYLRWRDQESGTNLLSARTIPDWGFARTNLEQEDSPQDTSERRLLTVSLRGDRPPPSPAWVAAVAAAAQRLDLTLIVAVQVERDGPSAQSLAASWGVHIVAFEGTHIEQERRLRMTYRQSRLILSDRLHVLILGLTEGAVPLAWCESSTAKIDRHLSHLGMPWVVAQDSPLSALNSFCPEQLDRYFTDAMAALAAARRTLVKTTDSLDPACAASTLKSAGGN